MRMKRRLWIALLLGGLPAAQVSADVYKFVDKKGHVYYTDRPPHSGYRLIATTRVSGRLGSPALAYQEASSGRASAPVAFKSGTLARNREMLAPLIAEAAERYDLDPLLLHAMIQAESAYNSEAVSGKGAVGLMQLMPDTAARYGVRDRTDPVENVYGGARYLRDLIGMFNDVSLAVAAYNAGENNIIKYGNRVPPFPETQDYLNRVIEYYNRLN
ncbi:transglycosylase SLT domain protein [Methylococcus capsulatus str. Bath]|uniref:Transglycosylase SLT domain protein n=1 Tax=Methylococcus capsulatus (strain ATCC 33009 / NCIMB 11132 / Bath) TaxID=243233 RepID=Q606K8_METCA|nr:lytic transglycosylase domain-containing protein [Methylococcus capsulatus]AAU91762.1 transglycosylase SLT domain protein [Methylococcus capsulatus str. Bath]